ncbi:unnamed protein product [Cuscuta europaea]|uniref:Transmembrane protein n=1 Tax=Cuscuta europaea TaxID=41803 RepID=A0A9P0VMS9_CUSEU|nr:unnamed protein product [Cuscuta europaea]CAH9115542.1 unnamed protein product [Cuscuta europaea]
MNEHGVAGCGFRPAFLPFRPAAISSLCKELPLPCCQELRVSIFFSPTADLLLLFPANDFAPHPISLQLVDCSFLFLLFCFELAVVMCCFFFWLPTCLLFLRLITS